MDTIDISVVHKIEKHMIANLICCALEGGSNYWYQLDWEKSVEPKKLWIHESFDGFKHLQWPLSEGGRLFIGNCLGDKENVGFLDLDSIKKGLELLMQNDYHFVDFMQEKEDAVTGDVFLQLALFGELIYG